MPLFKKTTIITTSEDKNHPGFNPGDYYLADRKHGTLTSNTSVVAPNTLSYFPFYVPKAIHIDRLMLNISTNTTNANLRLGIFNKNDYGKPTDLILDAGIMPAATIGYKELTCDLILENKIYLLGLNCNVAPGIRCLSSSLATNHFIGTTTPNYATENYGHRQSSVNYGAMPSTAPINNLSNILYYPIFWYRIKP